MGDDKEDKHSKKENYDGQNLNGNSHSNFVKIRRNQDEFYTARTQKTENNGNLTLRDLEGSGKDNNINSGYGYTNPLVKLNQLKYKMNEYDTQTINIKNSLDFLIQNSTQLISDTNEANKVKNYLEKIKSSNMQNVTELKRLYMYSNDLLISLERSI